MRSNRKRPEYLPVMRWDNFACIHHSICALSMLTCPVGIKSNTWKDHIHKWPVFWIAHLWYYIIFSISNNLKRGFDFTDEFFSMNVCQFLYWCHAMYQVQWVPYSLQIADIFTHKALQFVKYIWIFIFHQNSQHPHSFKTIAMLYLI